MTGQWELIAWPLPNVILGFSAEDQPNFDVRWEEMKHLAAAGWPVMCSYEPALGPVVIDADCLWPRCPACGRHSERGSHCSFTDCECALGPQGLLSWFVAGGESGPGARPSHPDWFRSARDQCAAAGVPFFFKQWGAWAQTCEHFYRVSKNRYSHETFAWGKNGGQYNPVNPAPDDFPKLMYRVGKKAAGALLDGQEWREFPKIGGAE